MPEKRTKKTTAAHKSAAKPAPPRKTVAPPKAAEGPAAASAAPAGVEVCPRCGTTKFAAEDRTRVDGRRTVRYTVLVCERGHTFAKPLRR